MYRFSMGQVRHFKLFLYVLAMLVVEIKWVESTVLIHFDEAPPTRSRFSTAIFRYSVMKPDGSIACKNNSCSFYCGLDGQTLRSCPTHNTTFRNLTINQEHNFVLNVTTRDGQHNSAIYSWFIDTTPPTATIFSKESYTSAGKIQVGITFSEACNGEGGFKCINSSSCDVTVKGPAYVDPSSLHIIKPHMKYSLDVIFSPKSVYARVIIRMADNFCVDEAGNHFTRTNGSDFIVHLDRRPVQVDLWMPVPSYELVINGFPRTIFATNNVDDLKVYLDFSSPVINSTAQILSALRVNSGYFISSESRSHGNRRFAFEIKNISRTEIVTVGFEAASITGRRGTPVSPAAPVTFLYDSREIGVGLSTSSPKITKESDINIIIEFTKPVFNFEASKVEVQGGNITRFEDLSRALYSLTVKAVSENVSISVPAKKVKDISGNLNLASNLLNVKHYSAPSISTALHSFITAGTLATSLAAAVLSLSSASLGAIGNLASEATIFTDTSMNLQGMVGHLQVFVLADWLTVSLPIEYSETTKGLRWLLPREKLPWKKESSTVWPDHLNLTESKLVTRESHLFVGLPSHKRAYPSSELNLTDFSFHLQEGPLATEIYPKGGWIRAHHNISTAKIPYGQPLESSEYFTYFLRGEPLSASNVIRKIDKYTGWLDLEMNLFWLGVGGVGLLAIHTLTYIFLRWRTQTSAFGILSVPRIELFFLILMLPNVSQSSGFVIRGGTTAGILAGTLLLAIPAGFILSVCLFLIIAIFSGSFVLYKQAKHTCDAGSWAAKFRFLLIGRPTIGQWVCKEGMPSSFLHRFGILFENRKGPPMFVLLDQNDPNNESKCRESGLSGIGLIRAVSSDASNGEPKSPNSMRLLGFARSSYIILDLLRRCSLGIVSGAFQSGGFNQSLFTLIITMVQFLFLITLKPFISRGVHVVESISLLCEAGVFMLSIILKGPSLIEKSRCGYAMLGFLFLSYVSQVINEWYSLIKCVLRFSESQKNSFKMGLKNAAKGLLLPFLSRRLAGSTQSKRARARIPPLSPETEYGRRITGASHLEPLNAMTATVVPVTCPGLSPEQITVQATGLTTPEATYSRQKTWDGKQLKGLKVESKREMKKLRQLARASFSGGQDYEEGNTSSAP